MAGWMSTELVDHRLEIAPQIGAFLQIVDAHLAGLRCGGPIGAFGKHHDGAGDVVGAGDHHFTEGQTLVPG